MKIYFFCCHQAGHHDCAWAQGENFEILHAVKHCWKIQLPQIKVFRVNILEWKLFLKCETLNPMETMEIIWSKPYFWGL